MDNNELLQAIRGIIKEEVRASVKEEVRASVKEEVRASVKEEVRASVKEEVRASVKEEVRSVIKEEINPRFDNLEDSMLLFNHRLDKMELTIENDINKNIKALYEGFVGINQKLGKLDKIDEDVEELKMKVEIVETYIKENNCISIN